MLLTLGSALSYGMRPFDTSNLRTNFTIPEVLLGKTIGISDEEVIKRAHAILDDPARRAAWDSLCQLGIAYEQADEAQFAKLFKNIEHYTNKWTTFKHETFERTWWDAYSSIIHMLRNTFDTKRFAFTQALQSTYGALKREATMPMPEDVVPALPEDNPNPPINANVVPALPGNNPTPPINADAPTIQATFTTELLATVCGLVGQYPLITTFGIAAVVITGSIYCYKQWQARKKIEDDKKIKEAQAATTEQAKTA